MNGENGNGGLSMAWIESHQNLDNHPKLFALMDALKIDRRTAMGTLHLLWHWCLDYAEDGRLDRFNPVQIAQACDWTGNAGEFLQTMADIGFLDRDPLRIHDWLDFCGDLVKKRLEYKTRKKERSGRILGESLRNLGDSQHTQPYPTIPNTITWSEFQKIWNNHCGPLPKAATCSESRKKHIRARWAEKPDAAYWQTVVRKLAASEFACKGNWANLDWIIANDNNHVKVMEGKYDNRGSEKTDPYAHLREKAQ